MSKGITFRIVVIMAITCLYNIRVTGQATTIPDRYPIIPYPSRLIPQEGNFTINRHTTIVVQYPACKAEAAGLAELIKDISGLSLAYTTAATGNSIMIRNDPAVSSKEGYHLQISPHQVILSASDPAGIFWGIETIRQLLPATGSGVERTAGLSLPAADITDAPAFSWRGVHIDVARHFFTEAYIKKFIDRMALYKLNRLHLHLTDDQGWRIEIKKYPELTKVGAWRTLIPIDSECIDLSRGNPDFTIDPEHIVHRDGKILYGGYYTQAQMKEIIRYAAARHVEVIPEIDMPGHMMAAMEVFPYLGCATPPKQRPGASIPLCPCEESTFTFAENIFKEIFALFPSKYIHIGGDEVDKSTWAQHPGCKEFMRREGLKDVDQLQSYFIRRMEKFFRAHDRTLIGWDEILEGGMDSSAVIMYWRNWARNAPERAARNGNNVIMTPGSPMYFSAWPYGSTLDDVYHYDPVPADLKGSPLADRIIGVQACIWTERIPSGNRVDYIAMPRMTALAEVGWTNQPGYYAAFLERLQHHYPRWDKMHIHYHLPALEGFTENNVFTDSTVLSVQIPLPDMVVHYTTDGTIPEVSSPVLPLALVIRKPVMIRLAAFTPGGNRGDIYSLNYKKETYADPVSVDNIAKGLTCTYYKGPFDHTGKMAAAAPARIYTVNDVSIPKDIIIAGFGLQYRGYITVPETGIYSFYLTSDDGSVLRIGNRTVVDNDGMHGQLEKSGQIALQKGRHLFSLDFADGGGGYALHLQYSRQGEAPQDVPAAFFTRNEQ